MDFSKHDYLTPENILFTVLANVADTELKKGLHLGWYHSEIQHCLEELSFDTLFDEKREDYPMTPDLRIDLSKGTFNVKEVYGYNGPLCEPGKMEKIWHKKDFYQQGNGRVVAKNRQDGSNDPFYQKRNHYLRNPLGHGLVTNGHNLSRHVHYYNIENGILMLSSSCKQFHNIHVRASGIAASLEDTPYIPQVFRTACIDYVSESACRVLMASSDNPKLYQYLQTLYAGRLDKEGFGGSWHNAAKMIGKMSAGEKNDYREYIARWRYMQ